MIFMDFFPRSGQEGHGPHMGTQLLQYMQLEDYSIAESPSMIVSALGQRSRPYDPDSA